MWFLVFSRGCKEKGGVVGRNSGEKSGIEMARYTRYTSLSVGISTGRESYFS